MNGYPVGDGWYKANASAGNGQCVEVKPEGGVVHVRDSKNPDGPSLSLPDPVFSQFVADAAAGLFDA